jgi:hypothetical protein
METEKLLLFENQKANPTTTWLLFLFLGWSYGSMNQMGLQIAYYLTLGGVGFWTLYRLFTLNRAIKEYNRGVAARLGFNNQEMSMLGLM